MSDRSLLIVLLAVIGFFTMVWLLSYQFYYWAFFDPDKPYLPQGSDQVISSVSSMMSASITGVAAIATALIAWKIAKSSMQAGQNAALSTPSNPITSEQK